MSRQFGVALLAFHISGCGASLQATELQNDIQELRVLHAEERQRLDDIRVEAVAAQEEANAARERARFEQCRAEVQQVQAQIAARQAACWVETAQEAQCSAENERRRSSSTMWGCLVGIGAAALTGGAATPLALAGCGGGLAVGEARTDRCSPPACRGQVYGRQEAMRDLHMSTLGMCGGYLGLTVETHRESGVGLPILGVGASTSAHAAGLRRGDTLVRIDGRAVNSLGVLGSALATVRGHQSIDVAIVRDGLLYVVRAPVAYRQFDGATASLPMLGVQLGDPSRTAYSAGARIVAVDGDGPASSAVHEQDILVRVNGSAVATEGALRDLLRLEAAGETVDLTLSRGGRQTEVRLTLAQRNGRHGI